MELMERLAAIEDIKQLKARYFRAMDGKDRDLLATIFTADAVFDARASFSADGAGPAVGNDWLFEGGETIVAFITRELAPLVSVHIGHGHEIEIVSPTEARGVIGMEDRISRRDRATIVPVMQGWGHYHERYRRDGGAWRIAHSRLTRLDVRLFQGG